MGAPHQLAQSGPQLSAGAVLQGKYRLVAPRGSGAMGAVWSARHVELGTSVAVKFLHPELAETPDARTRFAREAKLAARLAERCRYIARVIDCGVVSHAEPGAALLPDGEECPFLVMELLEGEELAERLRREKRLSLALTAQIVQQLCRALEVAHQAGVVHRDVKPANVFLARPQTNMSVFVKLMDFGVAKLVEGSSALEANGRSTTRIGAIVGTPAYMSPEQILGQRIDARADLWSVGVLIHRVLTGELPFTSGTLQETSTQIIMGTPPPPSSLVPELPQEIDAFMQRALAKRPDERFGSARELADALLAIAGPSALMPYALHPSPTPGEQEAPVSGLRMVRDSEPATVRVTHPALGRTHSGIRPRRTRRALLSVAAVVVLLVAGAALFASRGETPSVNVGDDVSARIAPVDPSSVLPMKASVGANAATQSAPASYAQPSAPKRKSPHAK